MGSGLAFELHCYSADMSITQHQQHQAVSDFLQGVAITGMGFGDLRCECNHAGGWLRGLLSLTVKGQDLTPLFFIHSPP